ncbi:MAG TPA: cytochrome c [Woeseiaceae bacterium]|nr:cytochrome c [Woeseiaceae bacterium]
MKPSRLLIFLILTGSASPGWGYPWDKDMVDQPSEKPQESVAPPGPGSIPLDGGETVPEPLTDEESSDMKDAAAAIENPVSATEESIARGKVFYEVNCLVCHGPEGRGDGPVGLKFVEKAPVDLNDAYTQDQADGQLFFTLTRGRVLMPFYRDALSPSERWDVINYVRSEFGDNE